MKHKKLLTLALLAIMSFNIVACNSTSKQEESQPQSSSTTTETQNEVTESDKISAEKKLLDVTVHLPASLTSDTTNEDINKALEEGEEYGIKNITKNDDGSIDIKMSKSGHKKILTEFKKNIDETLNSMIEDKETYPSFESITYNDDMTSFDVTVDPDKFSDWDSMYAITFYFSGMMYQAFNAVPEDEVKVIVNFVDKNTGEIIKSGDSSNLSNNTTATTELEN